MDDKTIEQQAGGGFGTITPLTTEPEKTVNQKSKPVDNLPEKTEEDGA